MPVYTEHGQACLTLDLAPAEPPKREVSTPWGTVAYSPDFMDMRGRGRERDSDKFPMETSVGPALGSIHLCFEDGSPSKLFVTVGAGYFHLMEKVGQPIRRNDRNIGWSCTRTLRLEDSMPIKEGDSGAFLTDVDAPESEWTMGFVPPSIRDPALSAAIVVAIDAVLESAARSDPGYAWRAYAAMVADGAVEAADEAEGARLAYVNACHERDRLMSFARNAEAVGRGGKEVPRPYPKPSTSLGEIRGFAGGNPGLDLRNVDEVVVSAPASVHLESMSDTAAWMGIELPGGRRVSVDLFVEKGKLVIGTRVES